MSPGLHISDSVLAGASSAARRSVDYLVSKQHEQGYWWGNLTSDSTLESDYILMQLWLHAPVNGVWSPPTRILVDAAAKSILARQLPDGGFNIYLHGPAEISATIKAYFALKLAGIPIDDPRLVLAKNKIRGLGGIEAGNSYVKINLSLFNLFPRELTPSVPPEMFLLGNFIYQMSSWTRAIVLPLAAVHAMNPSRPVPAGFNLQELFVGSDAGLARTGKQSSTRSFFLFADRVLKLWERFGSAKLRQHAIRKIEKWVVERTHYSDGLAAIYPSMQYAVMMLDLLGYGPEHPDRIEAEKQFNGLMVNENGQFFFQPCFSVVWDTAIAAFALGESEMAPKQVLARCSDWLLTKEVRRKGDWSIKRPNTEPSGWYFEFANEFYPDIDDTAMVLLALKKAEGSNATEQQASIRRAIAWILDMQGSDGGWAAFDVDNNWEFLSEVPFADHNAMLDPSCPDITGRVIESLIAHGVSPTHAAIRRGRDYLVKTQEAEGSWYGRWGVAYIYGTFLALRGLQASGESDREAHVLRGGEWLRAVQNADGGWGESCESYENNRFVAGPSTASQTAWAVLGLIAGGDITSESLMRGVEYLSRTQRADGGWDEDETTGTGFPKVFYLSYHMYRDSFPLLALSAFAKSQSGR